ncbi:MAG: hypothetical protein Q8P59_01770, partial [Dehalococcoidia bacterium]|nr:hypothetical protein [Dehalococcoidia bacterium]
AILRNNNRAATAPGDIDFWLDGQPLPAASFYHIIVAPGQEFTTATLRQLVLPATINPGSHRLSAKLSHPKGQDTNPANDSLSRVVEIKI